MVYQEHTRRRLRIGMLSLAGLGLLSLGFGLAAPSLSPDVPPVAVTPTTPATLPGTGLFGGTLALYGAATDDSPPSSGTLGCTLRRPDGRAAGRLHSQGAANLDRRVVDGQALVPLLLIESSAGWTITCQGPGAIAVQPLYLIATSGQRDLVPMAAFSFATLALVLGGTAGWRLRPDEE